MLPLPRRFFVTSGKALSRISELNAFDEALVAAGISEANLVPVSSVLPKKIAEVGRTEIERGSIVFCVLARVEGGPGETISAGLAYVHRSDGSGGYVAEGHIKGPGEKLKADIDSKAKQMASHRSIGIESPKFVIEELEVPSGQFGSCVVALVFLP